MQFITLPTPNSVSWHILQQNYFKHEHICRWRTHIINWLLYFPATQVLCSVFRAAHLSSSKSNWFSEFLSVAALVTTVPLNWTLSHSSGPQISTDVWLFTVAGLASCLWRRLKLVTLLNVSDNAWHTGNLTRKDYCDRERRCLLRSDTF